MVFINIELEHFYGPLDDNTKFVTWLIQTFIKNIGHIDLTLGEQTRNFIYITDVISAFEIIIDQSNKLEKGFHNYQVGSSQEITLREITILIKELVANCKTKLNFGAIPYRENENMKINLNISKLKNLGWEENVLLEKGLCRVIKEEIMRGSFKPNKASRPDGEIFNRGGPGERP
jgi:nucleoside-diphosphate-sugar epimerase